ncbi:unnamed protein product [Rhodiola kirilowii]
MAQLPFQLCRVFVDCSRLALEKASNIRQSLSRHISEALDHSPSLIILDDLDSIVSSSYYLDGSQASSLSEFLTDIVDEYQEKRKNSCGVGPIAFFATAQSLESIPLPLRCSGRFDFHIQLPALSTSDRRAILKHEIQNRFLHFSEDIISDVASKCDGFEAIDLEILVDRAFHAAIGRYVSPQSASEVLSRLTLLERDFSLAMHEFLPVAMQDIAKPTLGDDRSGWDDVGGLTDIQRAIKEVEQNQGRRPSQNKIKPNESSFEGVDYGASSGGGYENQGRRPSQNKIMPNESSFASVDYGASSGGYENQGRRSSHNKIMPNESSFESVDYGASSGGYGN